MDEGSGEALYIYLFGACFFCSFFAFGLFVCFFGIHLGKATEK